MVQRLLAISMVCGLVVPVLAEDNKKDDVQALQGEWKAVDAERGGKKAPAELLEVFRLEFKEGTLIIKTGEQMRQSKYTLDPTEKPKAIDIVPQDGPEKGKTLEGIYSLEKGQLRLCIPNGPTEGGRPKKFDSTDREMVLLTLERIKKE